jgi:pyridoxine/pyridoxamine 5'-phosphate oxidase
MSSFSDQPTTSQITPLSPSSHSTALSQKEKLLQCLASPSSANPKEELFMHNSLEQQIRITGKTRKIYSSTSSVYAEHTLSDPNNDQVLYW